MRKLLYLPLLFTVVSVYAQEKDSTKNLRFGTYTSIYNLYPNALENLNQQLRSNERLDLSDNIQGVSVGFTQRFEDQNSYLALRSSFFSATDMEDSDDHTRLRIWELSATSHYDVVPNQNWLAYPYLGIGANIANLVLLTQTPSSFENSLGNPVTTSLRQQYKTDLTLFADLGAGVERALRFPEATVYLGVSGGYRLSFSEPWSLDNLRYFTESEFSTQGWLFEIKLRSEINNPENKQNSRGLFKFFQ